MSGILAETQNYAVLMGGKNRTRRITLFVGGVPNVVQQIIASGRQPAERAGSKRFVSEKPVNDPQCLEQRGRVPQK